MARSLVKEVMGAVEDVIAETVVRVKVVVVVVVAQPRAPHHLAAAEA